MSEETEEGAAEAVTMKSGRIWRTIAIIAVIVAFFAILIANTTTEQSTADKVWDKAMTVGNLEAKNHYVMYTDLMCPYCDFFSRAVLGHWEEFEKYLEEHDILFEVRMTDYLYTGMGSQYSRNAAEAAYCAARDEKFWDFYHGALTALWDDYHSKGIGDSKTSPSITDMPEDYWQKIAHKAGLGESFDNCVANHEPLDEIDYNTKRALQVAQGMPYFKFNKFTLAGFDSAWGWDYVLRYLDAGLENK